MIFTETKLAGAFVIDVDRKEDNRGFFARVFCQHEFEEHGLKPVIAQANVAFNHRARARMRGMHFQYPPAAETKLVRCTRGAILDIIVDLRPESPTYLEHVAVELSADNHRALYVPERFAHGYQVLEDDDGDELPGRRVLRPRPRGRARRTTTRPRSELAAAGDARSPRRTPTGRRSRRSEPRSGRGCRPPSSLGRRGSVTMIIVDNALAPARARRAARSGSGSSAPASWRRAWRTDRQQRRRACAWPRSTAAGSSARRRSTSTPGSGRRPSSSTPGRGRGRRRAPAAR